MYERLNKNKMFEEIKATLLLYFRDGKINEREIFTLNDLKFDLEEILKIHLMLSNKTKNFLDSITRNFNDVVNSTKRNKLIFKNTIKGSINWHETIIARDNFGLSNNDFICTNIDKLYNTNENIILKEALRILYDISYKEIGMERFTVYDWYDFGKKHLEIITKFYTNNIYINKIDLKECSISDRMIGHVLKSRKKLYRDAAKLVKYHRDIFNDKLDQIDDLLSNTYIEMKSEAELFELYVIFKYIEKVLNTDNVNFNLINGTEKYLASYSVDNKEGYIYHNKTGEEFFYFNIDFRELELFEDFTNKLNNINLKLNSFKKIYNIRENTTVWAGRPDLIIVEKDCDNNQLNVLIGEIKYTIDQGYIFQGLEELLEYLEFIKVNKKYTIKNLMGILFVLDTNLLTIEKDNIEIINVSKDL